MEAVRCMRAKIIWNPVIYVEDSHFQMVTDLEVKLLNGRKFALY